MTQKMVKPLVQQIHAEECDTDDARVRSWKMIYDAFRPEVHFPESNISFAMLRFQMAGLLQKNFKEGRVAK